MGEYGREGWIARRRDGMDAGMNKRRDMKDGGMEWMEFEGWDGWRGRMETSME